MVERADVDASLSRRLEREHRARLEAEQIAEQVTAQLYATGVELTVVNDDLVRANQELQELNQALRDFVAVASHDLRNPLTAILGWADTATQRWEDIDDALKRRAFDIVAREAQHMARLVEDLLTLSRLEADALDTHADVVALRAAVDEVIQGVSAQGVEVALSEDVRVLADADHLRRILENYVTNALKYGSPPIEVIATADGEWVEIRVRDLGDGVPPDFVPRLFGRFARAETERTREERGTGLGLSIVKGLARANGGDAWYEPNAPKGSCFGVRLPRVA